MKIGKYQIIIDVTSKLGLENFNQPETFEKTPLANEIERKWTYIFQSCVRRDCVGI